MGARSRPPDRSRRQFIQLDQPTQIRAVYQELLSQVTGADASFEYNFLGNSTCLHFTKSPFPLSDFSDTQSKPRSAAEGKICGRGSLGSRPHDLASRERQFLAIRSCANPQNITPTSGRRYVRVALCQLKQDAAIDNESGALSFATAFMFWVNERRISELFLATLSQWGPDGISYLHPPKPCQDTLDVSSSSFSINS